MWGGGGGLIEYRSALLASHGFASLALLYMASKELSAETVDASYFEVTSNFSSLLLTVDVTFLVICHCYHLPLYTCFL